MPRNTRELLIRYYSEAMNDLERALEKMQKISEAYGDIKPQHRDFMDNLGFMLLNVHDAFKVFRETHM